ncbi:autotransporter domain-containing protein [Rhodanobacter sp. DHB23]|uniref:autotransporter outer membrane beta-barrel domain-containing protein n=1 Tax=Rhodanobacter sp. DHB23 TaxID=2775923 RepID=UPI0017807BD8|nr:autotransporter domain-containing protein [Rhodanobacter sp. DHB23]MBD8872616.1 autotransporter domain-containing protein [Rhodanobacter sp. DHB23]
MLRTRHLVGAIATALLFSTAAGATDFSKVVVFGDSLSDAGNISLASNPSLQPPMEFTTNPGHVAVQDLAGDLGYTLGPSLAGGTDYAWGGAGILTNSPGTPAAVPTITSQVNTYLAAGSVDPHALYTIWGGANDIFYAATSAGAAATAQALIQQNVAAQIAQLEQAGYTAAQIQALTPTITQQVTTAVSQQVLAAAGVSSFMTADQAQAAIGAAAQQEVKLIGELQAAGVKNLVVFNLPNIGVTPDGTEQGATAAAQLTGLSVIFNSTLNSGLGQLGKGIIPVNTYALINEVVANPSLYGFSNVTTPACGVGSSSVQCGPAGSGAPYTYAAGTDQSYLFADGVHPTTAAHEMLSQVVLSELNAPGQISLLGETALASATQQTSTIRNEMLADSNGGATRAFVNVNYAHQSYDAQSNSPKTTSNDVNLTLGADARINDNLSAGIALGVGQSNADFAGGGGYQLQDISGLGYLTYHQGGGYVGGYLNFGQSNFSDIDRRIQIGAASRGETGKADGSHLGGGLTGGWWFDVGSLRTGPYANIEWESIKVDGYSEDGNDSTAMWFGRQQRNALIGTLGWRVQGNWQAGGIVLTPYADIGWNNDSKADARDITAGLNSMNGNFALPGFTPDKNWGSADLGLSAQFSQQLSGWVGYSGHFSDNSQKYNSLNLGLKYNF